jgi:hypothetical protein
MYFLVFENQQVSSEIVLRDNEGQGRVKNHGSSPLTGAVRVSDRFFLDLHH